MSIASPLIGPRQPVTPSYWLPLTCLSHLQFLTLTIPHTDRHELKLSRLCSPVSPLIGRGCVSPGFWLAGCGATTRTVCQTRHCWLPTVQPPALLWSLREKSFWCGKKSGLTNNLTPFKCAGVNLEPARNSFVVSEISHKPKGFTIPRVWNWQLSDASAWCTTANNPTLQRHSVTFLLQPQTHAANTADTGSADQTWHDKR